MRLAHRSSSSSLAVPLQAGSETVEYALVMVLAATIAALALAWARNGGVAGLLGGVLQHVRSMFGIG
jgi:hypothetical protein